MAAKGSSPLTPPEARALIDKHLYDASIIPTLENYVHQQCKENLYDYDANRHLLKLYKFHPSEASAAVAGKGAYYIFQHIISFVITRICIRYPNSVYFQLYKVLIKAMMHLPASDYVCCLYLLPLPLHNEEPIRTILRMRRLKKHLHIQANLLETFQMKKFWKELEDQKSCKALLDTPGFIAAVEKCIITIVKSTYFDISVSTLADLLRKKEDVMVETFFDEEMFNPLTFIFVQRLQKENGWEMSKDGKMVILSKKKMMSTRVEGSQKITLQQVSKVLPLLQ
eukprot:jgi/Bigna1/86192/estExt_fgenesh1_pg.C_80289